MKRLLSIGLLLGGMAVFAADQPSAATILQRYLKLPFPEEDRVGEARTARLRTLDELKSTPETAVGEISRVLPDVKDPRQRGELVEALRFFPTKESADVLCKLLDDSEPRVRLQAIFQLRSLTGRVDRSGGQRWQRGDEHAPKVAGLVPWLIKAAGDPVEQNRVTALYALADTREPEAVAELRRRLQDESRTVRFHAACFLTEFQDASGLPELKQAVARFHEKPADIVESFDVERLLASLERITGKHFADLPPINPMISSDTRAIAAGQRRYAELIEAWHAWWNWMPPDDGKPGAAPREVPSNPNDNPLKEP